MSIQDVPDGGADPAGNRFFDDEVPEIRGARRANVDPADDWSAGDTVFVAGSVPSSQRYSMPETQRAPEETEAIPAIADVGFGAANGGPPMPVIESAESAEPGELRWSRVVHDPSPIETHQHPAGADPRYPGHAAPVPAGAAEPFVIPVPPPVGRPERGGLTVWWAEVADRRGYWSIAGGAVLAALFLLGFVALNLRGNDSGDASVTTTAAVEAGTGATLGDANPNGPELADSGGASSGSFQSVSTTSVQTTAATSQNTVRPTATAPPTSSRVTSTATVTTTSATTSVTSATTNTTSSGSSSSSSSTDTTTSSSSSSSSSTDTTTSSSSSSSSSSSTDTTTSSSSSSTDTTDPTPTSDPASSSTDTT